MFFVDGGKKNDKSGVCRFRQGTAPKQIPVGNKGSALKPCSADYLLD